MSRRQMATVLVAVACLPGCGLGLHNLAGEPHFWVFTETIDYQEPPHRVALAALEAMRLELASADFAAGHDSRFAVATMLMKPGMKVPRPGEPVPPDYPAFWADWTARNDGHKERNLVILIQADFDGQTREGQPVRVSVARGEATQVTIRVGRRGDPGLSKALSGRIADRLAHPLHPAGSPEEAETLRALFGGVESREAIPSFRKPASGPPG